MATVHVHPPTIDKTVLEDWLNSIGFTGSDLLFITDKAIYVIVP